MGSVSPSNHTVFVAGVDYPHFNSESNSAINYPLVNGTQGSTRGRDWNWRTCCLRLAQITSKKYGKDCAVTLFDFDRGTRETLTCPTGELQITSSKSLGALTFGNYRILDDSTKQLRPLQPSWPKNSKDDRTPPSIFYLPGIDKLGSGVIPYSDYETAWSAATNRSGSGLSETSISIIHVYDFIRSIAASKKDSKTGVRELHFFSHAWQDGPILVNTPDLVGRNDKNAALRDPFDKDCRRTKDFNQANYTSTQLEQFKAAFADDAVTYLWGCDMDQLSKELIRQTALQLSRGLSSFQFTFTKCWGNPDTFAEKLGGDATKSKRISMGDIVQFLNDMIDDTYMRALAEATKRPVIGALPGTSSDPDRGVPSQKLLWHVGGTMKNDSVESNDCYHPSNQRDWLAFYSKHCNVKFDTTYLFDLPVFNTSFGRGFVRTKPLVP
jgi:hypothetical protein